MAKREGSIICLIIGILLILGGGAFSSSFFYTYRDWVEIEYSAQDLKCYSAYQGRGTKTTRCTVQYHYTFSGQSYSVVSNFEKPTNGQNGTFYINPQDPEKHFTMFDGYVGLGIMGTGFIMLLFAGLFTALNKSRKEIQQ